MALAVDCASAGAVVGVQAVLQGPAAARAEAVRAPARTELLAETTSRISSDISMMPKSITNSSGVTRAASTATAPRSLRPRRPRMFCSVPPHRPGETRPTQLETGQLCRNGLLAEDNSENR